MIQSADRDIRQGATAEQATDCPSLERLNRLLSDDLPTLDATAVVQHLDACTACRQRLQNLAGDEADWRQAVAGVRDEQAFEPELERVTRSLKSATQQTLEFRRLSAAADANADPPTLSLDFLSPSDREDALGKLDDYEVLEVVGQGGMGLVLRAWEPALARTVALKVLVGSRSIGTLARKRLRREAQAVAAVNSPHVVAIYAVHEATEVPYLVMEFVDGMTLESLIQTTEVMPWDEVIRIGKQIAAGLQVAHDRGLVHRDIKPDNVLLERVQGRVKISDFGLARAVDDVKLTRQGCVSGTPAYMSPEQCTDADIDHRSDLFSLGSVLYTMCTGRPPFTADATMTVLHRTQHEAPQPIQAIRPDVPAELCDVIERLLAKRREDRFQTAAEVGKALTEVSLDVSAAPWQPPQQPLAAGRRWSLLALAASVLLLVGGVVASEVTGFSAWTASAAVAIGVAAEDPPATDDAVKREGGGDRDGNGDLAEPAGAHAAPAVVVQPPQRIQIVTPDGLMREQIQLEKDATEATDSSFLVRKFEGHDGPVNALAVTPDGKFAVSGSGWPSGDKTLRLWDVASGEQVRQFDVRELPLHPTQTGPREAPGEVQCVAVTPDGKHLVAGLVGGAVGLWDLASGELLRQFEGHTSSVYALAVSPDGRQLLTGGRDSSARLWDLNSGQERLRLPTKNWVRSVAFSPDGTRVMLGTYSKQMLLVELASARVLDQATYQDWVWKVTFSPDGKRAAIVTGKHVSIRDVEKKTEILQLKHPENLTCAAWSADGSQLLTGGYDFQVRLWDATGGELLETFRGHRGWVWNVIFLPGERQFMTSAGGRYTPNQGTNAGIDFSMRLWELPQAEPRVIERLE